MYPWSYCSETGVPRRSVTLSVCDLIYSLIQVDVTLKFITVGVTSFHFLTHPVSHFTFRHWVKFLSVPSEDSFVPSFPGTFPTPVSPLSCTFPWLRLGSNCTDTLLCTSLSLRPRPCTSRHTRSRTPDSLYLPKFPTLSKWVNRTLDWITLLPDSLFSHRLPTISESRQTHRTWPSRPCPYLSQSQWDFRLTCPVRDIPHSFSVLCSCVGPKPWFTRPLITTVKDPPSSLSKIIRTHL